jgi:hypothetical protein
MALLGIDSTPNPNAAKITFDQTVSPKAQTFSSADAAKGHPIAAAVFTVEGVASVFMVNDFATVTKRPDATWPAMMPKLQAALAGL